MTAFNLGGVDYVTKPFQFEEVEARVETHLALRAAQFELERYNLHLQDQVKDQLNDLPDSHMATIFALAKLAECRDEDTGTTPADPALLPRAGSRLAEDRRSGITEEFIEQLFHACALHDIGKVGIPDTVLLKPGQLAPAEVEVMKQHTVLGAETLAAVLARDSNNVISR